MIEEKIGDMKMISERLPDLTDEVIQDASKEDSIEWAEGMLVHYEPGCIHEMSEYGITLQIISSDTARCISVYDHRYCLFMLQVLITTFQSAGLTLEIDPYTVLRPYEAPKETGDSEGIVTDIPGENFVMEVV